MKNLLLTLISASFCLTLQAQNSSYPNNAGNGNSGTHNTSIGWEAGQSLTAQSFQNTFLGHRSGEINTANFNSFIGSFSGLSNVSGTFNTFLGARSGLTNSVGVGNTYLGSLTGEKATGSNNVFVGAQSGVHTTGNLNTFLGTLSGSKNMSGGANVFLGYSAGLNNEVGGQNVFIGHAAGSFSVSTSASIFIGNSSGRENTGHTNTFIGNESGYNNAGTQNTFLGYFTGRNNSIGDSNTFLGHFSGFNNTTGKSNLFVGSGSGKGNTIGDYNVYLGTNTGTSNQSGEANVIVGFNSGFHSQSSNSVFVGYLSGTVTTGNDNTFIGNLTGNTNTSGTGNTFMGSESGKSNKEGRDNVYVGRASGTENMNGSENVYVGYQAGAKGQRASRNVFLGYEAGYYEEESNKLYISNNRKTNLIYGDFDKSHVAIGTIPPIPYQDKYTLYVDGDAFATGFWQSSDARLKKNRQAIDGALDKVRKIEGITYSYKSDQEINLPKGKQVGFMAQELKEVLPEAVAELEDGSLAVDYSKVVPLLVEAIKELSGEIENMKATTQSSSEGIQSKDNDKGREGLRGFGLEQNYPNPADGETTITYQLPADFAGKARLVVFDLQGKKVSEIRGLQVGKNSIKLDKNEIGAGLFHYSLVVDNQIVETKKMLLE